MEPRTVISVEAVYEDGVLRPLEPLPLHPRDRVVVRVEVPAARAAWPADVAELYRELEADDRELAGRMWRVAGPTWPAGDAP